jgi:hypothetical protein
MKTILLVLGFLSALTAVADTLLKEKELVAIGYGNIEAGKIQWKDCSGRTVSTFSAPPYWVKKSHNCDLNPTSFGIEKREKGYFVIDAKAASLYFPGARVGDEVQFAKSADDHSLILKSGERTSELIFRGAPQNEVHMAGCIEGGPGSYTLHSESGETVPIAVGGRVDLARHVGHEVQVTGTWKAAEYQKPKKQVFEVTRVTAVSSTCTTL